MIQSSAVGVRAQRRISDVFSTADIGLAGVSVVGAPVRPENASLLARLGRRVQLAGRSS